MFLHTHPYEPFIFEQAEKLIVGTLPPPRFTTGELKADDVDFCYGSRNGMLWPILDRIFDLGLVYENTHLAIEQRKNFLLANKIGVCDIVESAEREKVDASDLGMQNVRLRNLLHYLERYQNLKTVLFMGGNSKNGPEYFFRKLLKPIEVKLETISEEVPRIYRFQLPETDRKIQTVSLTAPSGAANRAVGSLASYKRMKATDANFNTLDFRVLQYRDFFLS
ncbi:uracil-DNA glycosylase family protein [Zobellia galactanivorans]|uniref:uracil-DNA glycosylase family protein n=1 Tax=Zobellia galactanivorans (strain DSM 12802 / CCUG 47099 / CIP 106680 / NCIMB 13871 / Dsij) TaxID=63186 RepID=UPI0026E292EC|nr:uracil-DNA glycosylase family protein [Zobellia galactanivorans]MDO6809589.1 uracil-DNA glycosylase family protein [Zobellia galactanivorans]